MDKLLLVICECVCVRGVHVCVAMSVLSVRALKHSPNDSCA